MGRSTFYNHFRGKGDIAFEVAFEDTAPVNDTMEALGAVDPRDQGAVGDWLAAVHHRFCEYRPAVHLVVQSIAHDRHAAERAVEIQYESAGRMLESLTARGFTIRPDAFERARVLVMMVNRWLFFHAVQEVHLQSGGMETMIDVVSKSMLEVIEQAPVAD
jgi:AcrR family transcriptional regulator